MTETPESKLDFSEELETKTTRRVNLLPQAQEEISHWLAYVAAQDEIKTLKGSTGFEIMDASNTILQIMKTMKTTIPDTLQTPSVQARINVMLTKAHLLDQKAKKKEKDASEIFELAHDLIVEFDNFKLQLNEIFLKTPTDFELELDEEFQQEDKRDSLPSSNPE